MRCGVGREQRGQPCWPARRGRRQAAPSLPCASMREVTVSDRPTSCAPARATARSSPRPPPGRLADRPPGEAAPGPAGSTMRCGRSMEDRRTERRPDRGTTTMMGMRTSSPRRIDDAADGDAATGVPSASRGCRRGRRRRRSCAPAARRRPRPRPRRGSIRAARPRPRASAAPWARARWAARCPWAPRRPARCPRRS